MTRRAWKAPLAVGLVGIGAAASLAFAEGMTTGKVVHLLVAAGVGAVGTGAVAAGMLRLARRRSITVQVAVATLAPVVAVGIAVALAASAMFLMARDVVVLSVALVAAGTLALIVALLLGQDVVHASGELTAMARRLAESGGADGPDGPQEGPGELTALARELEETAARLAEARARAERTERTRRELIAWVSHDLRTPLAGIRAMTEALQDGVVEDPETVARYLDTIHSETARLSGLVDDLFELSRIQAGSLRLGLSQIPLGRLIGDVVDASRAASSVELVLDVPTDLPELELSGSEVMRALRNLLDNALRHSPADGRVVVAAGNDTERCWISVSDQCGGIPEHDLERLFEPGWRGNLARTPGDGRAGLGLAIAKGLVEAHGGEIDVANIDGGCRFTVWLPVTLTSRPARTGSVQQPGTESAEAG